MVFLFFVTFHTPLIVILAISFKTVYINLRSFFYRKFDKVIICLRRSYPEEFWLTKVLGRWLNWSKQLYGNFFGGRGPLQFMF